MREIWWVLGVALAGCATEEPPLVLRPEAATSVRVTPVVEAPLAKAKRLSTGFATRAERTKATAIFESLCKDEDQEACAWLVSARVLSGRSKEQHQEDVALSKRACEAGSARGCSSLGMTFLLPLPDAESALRWLKKGCDQGDADGCAFIPRVLRLDPQSTPEEKLPWWKKACDGGSATGCYLLGLAYQDGIGVPRDPTAAQPLFALACKGGDRKGCEEWLGDLQRNGGAAEHATEIIERATLICDQGGAFGCMALGSLCLEGPEAIRNEKVGLTRWEQACDRELGDACEKLIVYDREHDQEELSRITRKKLCDLGQARACGNAPFHAFNAAEYGVDRIDRECAKGSSSACLQVGTMLITGDPSPGHPGVARDVPRGIQALEAACEVDSSTCVRLADEYAGGANVPLDDAHANQLWEKGCKAHWPDSCEGLGRSYLYGRGVPKNETTAFRYLRMACSPTRMSACDELDNHHQPH